MIFKRHIFAVIIARICHCEAKPKQSLFPFRNITGRVWAIIITLFLFFHSTDFLALSLVEGAETKDSILSQSKEIISEGTYNMGDGETPGVAESRALLQAKRTALEQAGTYVESWTKVKNLQLTEDEIKVLSSGLMEVEIIDKKRTIVGDGIHFWVKIKAIVNLDKTEEMAKRVKEKSVVEDYKKIQEAYDKSQRDIEELKKQLSQAKGEKEKKQVEAKITGMDKLYQVFEWYEKSNKYILNGNYDEAIKAYTNSLSSEYGGFFEAYANRGIAYTKKGQYNEAIEDYSKALDMQITKFFSKEQYNKMQEQYNKINVSYIPPPPSYNEVAMKEAAIYHNRGIAYAGKGLYERAIEDFNKAIELNPNDANAYLMRGETFSNIKLYDRAIDDYSKAIALKPQMPGPYIMRGVIYCDDKEDHYHAILDYKKAIDISPEIDSSGPISTLIGLAYNRDEQYDLAIKYLNKAIMRNPNNAEAYYFRGQSYAGIGQYSNRTTEYLDKVIEDFASACELGHRKACEVLKKIRKR